jgi:3-hydroxyacyl-CoA dehydrogenase
VARLRAGEAAAGERPADIADHLVGEMAAEGAAILAEGIAARPADIDLVAIHGHGFPRRRGGPMHYTAARDGR